MNKLNSGHFEWGGLDVKDEDTADTQLANWAADYLSKDHSQPFFMACGFYRPPPAVLRAPEVLRQLSRRPRPKLPSYLKNDLDDVPATALRTRDGAP